MSEVHTTYMEKVHVLFAQVEREHLFLPQRVLFLSVMHRDYLVPEYYMNSASLHTRMWALAHDVFMHDSLAHWKWLNDSKYIDLESYSVEESITKTEGRVRFKALEKGQRYVMETAGAMNRALQRLTGNLVISEEMVATEEQILGLDLLTRYIRVK